MSNTTVWNYWQYLVKENILQKIESLDIIANMKNIYCYTVDFRESNKLTYISYVHFRVYFNLDDVQQIECTLDPSCLKDLVIKIKKELPILRDITGLIIDESISFKGRILSEDYEY